MGLRVPGERPSQPVSQSPQLAHYMTGREGEGRGQKAWPLLPPSSPGSKEPARNVGGKLFTSLFASEQPRSGAERCRKTYRWPLDKYRSGKIIKNTWKKSGCNKPFIHQRIDIVSWGLESSWCYHTALIPLAKIKGSIHALAQWTTCASADKDSDSVLPLQLQIWESPNTKNLARAALIKTDHNTPSPLFVSTLCVSSFLISPRQCCMLPSSARLSAASSCYRWTGGDSDHEVAPL